MGLWRHGSIVERFHTAAAGDCTASAATRLQQQIPGNLHKFYIFLFGALCGYKKHKISIDNYILKLRFFVAPLCPRRKNSLFPGFSAFACGSGGAGDGGSFLLERKLFIHVKGCRYERSTGITLRYRQSYDGILVGIRFINRCCD
jgi:hypothetical protein